MKTFDTDIKKYADKVSLKATERRELRERVLSYMEYHPLPKQSLVPRKVSIPQLFSDSFQVVHFNIRSLPVRVGAGVFMFFVIAAPFAAERSVPGDTLYLVKTGITEPIQGQLANSPYEKIEFETKLMERRISEARELASEGKLTDDVKTQIAATVREHTEAVKTEIAELETQDADGAAIAKISFSSSLEVQSAVLGVNENASNTSSIDSILVAVNEAHEDVTAHSDDDVLSFESLSAKVELETTRAYELFEAIKTTAIAEEVSDIDRRITDINRLIAEAKEKNATDSAAALLDLKNTLGLTQKLITFMTDIDVRETVALETLVPVVLSETERVDRVNDEIKWVTELQITVRDRIGTSSVSVSEKVTEGLLTVDELVTKTSSALKLNDIAGAEAAIKEARVLMTDIDVLTLPPETDPDAPLTEVEETPAVDQGTSTPDGEADASVESVE